MEIYLYTCATKISYEYEYVYNCFDIFRQHRMLKSHSYELLSRTLQPAAGIWRFTFKTQFETACYRRCAGYLEFH